MKRSHQTEEGGVALEGDLLIKEVSYIYNLMFVEMDTTMMSEIEYINILPADISKLD